MRSSSAAPVEVASPAQDLGARPVRHRQPRVERERRARLALGQREPAQRRERQRVRRAGLGALRLDGAELRELPPRLDRPPQPEQRLARREPRVAVAGVDGQRRAVLAQRLLRPLAAQQEAAHVEVRLGEVLVEGERGREVLLGARPVLVAQRHEPEAVLGLGEARLVVEREGELPRGPVQLAARERRRALGLQRDGARVKRPRVRAAQRRQRSGHDEPKRPTVRSWPLLGCRSRDVGQPRSQLTPTAPAGSIVTVTAPSRSVRSTATPCAA